MNKEIHKLILSIRNEDYTDEHTDKHIHHGLSILLSGENPSDQSNFIDYTTSGINHTFPKSKWGQVYKILNNMSQEDMHLQLRDTLEKTYFYYSYISELYGLGEKFNWSIWETN